MQRQAVSTGENLWFGSELIIIAVNVMREEIESAHITDVHVVLRRELTKAVSKSS